MLNLVYITLGFSLKAYWFHECCRLFNPLDSKEAANGLYPCDPWLHSKYRFKKASDWHIQTKILVKIEWGYRYTAPVCCVVHFSIREGGSTPPPLVNWIIHKRCWIIHDIKQAHVNLSGGIDTLEDTDHAILFFNHAVILYHMRQHHEAIRILEKLFQIIEPLGEYLVW